MSHPRDPRLRGLYAITDGASLPEGGLVPAVAAAIQGGARIVQYRDKSSDNERRRWEATDLLTLCRSLGVPLIINDDVELAAEIGADGVHLGRDDVTPAEARHALCADAIIGVSCYNDLERASHFHETDIDYLAFGAFFPSPTKPAAARADIELLRSARAEFDKPIVCIGGITPENGRPLVEAGADMLAVISGLFAAADIAAAARAYAELFRD